MSTTARMFSVPGQFFNPGVAEVAGETAARPAEEKRSLPDGTFQLLTSLPSPKDAEEQAELSSLLAERYSLNQRTQVYVDRKLTEMRAGLEADHEASKAAVRAQLEVIETLKGQYGEAAREWHTAKGRVVEAQLKMDEARQGVKSISRFASSAAIASAQKKWVLAQAELDKAREPEGEALRAMNYINLTLLPAELEKRDKLILEETRLAAQLRGEDPDLATLGFVARA
jgi:hypothetical protein